GIPEAVEHEGSVVPDFEDVEPKLAKAIVDVLSGSSRSRSSNECEQKWTWQSTVINEVDTYEQVLKEDDPDD
uniref:hypothetical protein n=1 Tax=uncultured Mesotoga sp. TaxID=1184400 RepID=UPI002596E240